MSDLKKIDFENGVLKTDTHTYRIDKSISVERYIQFELLQSEVAFGYTFDNLNKIIEETITTLNKTDFVGASVLLYNLRNSITNGLEKRKHPILKLCSLFLIREDEDAAKYDELLQNEKIEDFEKSGVDYQDFFTLSMNLLPGLLEAYKRISRTISEGAMGLIKEQMKQVENGLKKATEKGK